MLSWIFSPNTHHRLPLGSVLAVLALGVPTSGLGADSPAPAAPTEVQFMRDIAPILAQRCFSCHGPKEPEKDLRLDIYEGMTKGEHPAVVPGEPEHSEMIKRITEEDTSSRMPQNDDPLSPADVDLIRRWIKAGAKFDGPDPKTPYKAIPDAPGSTAAAAPHPVHPPAPPSDRVQENRSKAGASER